MQIEKQPAVGLLDYTRYELAVRKLVGARAEVVHAGLDGDRHRQRVLQVADGGGHRLDAGNRLSGWQEEARGELGRLVEAQVVARPGCLELADRIAEELQLRRVGPDRSAHRGADAVDELAPRQADDVLEHLLVHAVRLAWVARLDPRRLRLDLQHLDQLRPTLEQRLGRAVVGEADAERRWASGSGRSP